jgi:hypothetical protein
MAERKSREKAPKCLKRGCKRRTWSLTGYCIYHYSEPLHDPTEIQEEDDGRRENTDM